MRNALAHVPKGQNTVVAAAIRQVFLQPDHAAATQTWRHVADQLRDRWPKLGACMDDAEQDVLAYMTFATLTLKAKVKIVRVQKDSEKAPDARVYAGTTELGAAWSKTSREDRSYMAVKLDDPSFPAPMYANLVEGEDGSFNLIWSR